MSPSAAAPSSASQIACSRTSASLWPSNPLSCAISTPPTTSLRPGTRRWTSKPWPTRRSDIDASLELEDELRDAQVLGEGHLDVRALALHEPRRVVADRLHRLGLVGRGGLVLEPTAQQPVAEHLRRLRAPQVQARDGGGDTLVLVGALQRIGERHREEPAHLIILELVQELLDELGLDAGARGIMHEHPIVLRDAVLEVLQRVEDRLGTVRAAAEERLDLVGERAPVVGAPVAVERREADVHARDARHRRQRLDRVEHHWLAGDGQVLLGEGVADAGALAGGGNQCEDFLHDRCGGRGPLYCRAMTAKRILALLACLAAGCEEVPKPIAPVAEAGEMVVLTVNGPATYFEDAQGLPSGFEYDLAPLFAKELKVRASFLVIDNPARIDKLLREGQAHIAAAALARHFDFPGGLAWAPAYFNTQHQIACRTGEPKARKLDDLQGKRIGVIEESVGDYLMSEPQNLHLPVERLPPGASTADLLAQVADGRLDCALVESTRYTLARRFFPQLEVAVNVGKPVDYAWLVSTID